MYAQEKKEIVLNDSATPKLGQLELMNTSVTILLS